MYVQVLMFILQYCDFHGLQRILITSLVAKYYTIPNLFKRDKHSIQYFSTVTVASSFTLPSK